MTLFIDNFFENASPMDWDFSDDTLTIATTPDHERFSVNKQTSHWNFKIIVPPEMLDRTISFRLKEVFSCWNGNVIPAFGSKTLATSVSYDNGESWETIPFQESGESGIAKELKLNLTAPIVHVANTVPYTTAELEQLKQEITEQLTVETIGQSVEGRDLEMITIGSGEHGVFLRGRAHPWESGGSWVIDGLLRRLADRSDRSAEILNKVTVHVMPMAAIDGVVKGMTRFTVNGFDLNRNWHSPCRFDPELCPENDCLVRWLEQRREAGKLPKLAICLHNDEDGRLHLSHPQHEPEQYFERMARLEALLRKHTWFAEGASKPDFHNPGSFGEGLNECFGIDALIWELHASYARGLERPPLHSDWQSMGANFANVLYHYF